MVEMMEVIEQNIFVFAAWMRDGGGVLFVAIELEIIGALGETKNVGMLVFVGGIIEKMNVGELINSRDELSGSFGTPVTLTRKSASIGRIFAIKIVIAEGNESRRNRAKIGEPSGEAFELAWALDGVERIDEIAGDENIIWMFGGDLRFNSGKGFGANGRAEMDVAHEQKFELGFDGRLIEFVTREIETVHLLRLYYEFLDDA